MSEYISIAAWAFGIPAVITLLIMIFAWGRRSGRRASTPTPAPTPTTGTAPAPVPNPTQTVTPMVNQSTTSSPKKDYWGWVPSIGKVLSLVILVVMILAAGWVLYEFGGQYVRSATNVLTDILSHRNIVAFFSLGLLGAVCLFFTKQKVIGGILIITAIVMFAIGLDNVMTIGNNIGRTWVQATDPNATTKSSAEESTTGPIIFGRNETSIIRKFDSAVRMVQIPPRHCVGWEGNVVILESEETYLTLRPTRPGTVILTVYSINSERCKRPK